MLNPFNSSINICQKIPALIEVNNLQGRCLNFVYIEKKSDIKNHPENTIILHEKSNFFLIPKYPIVFQIIEEEDGYAIEEPLLSLHVYADNKEDIEKELKHDLEFLWKRYALHPDNDLTPKALELKKNLLYFFRKQDV